MKTTVENFRGKLRIRWRYQGKPYCLSLGIEATATNKGYAKQIADKVLGDILLGQFDDGLVKYKPWVIGSDPAGVSCPELFEAYSAAMKVEKGLVAGSLAKYQGCLSHIKTALDKPAWSITPREAECFRAVLSERLSPSTVKTYLFMLQSSFSWASGRYKVPDENPWNGQAAKVKSRPRTKVKPFSQSEVKRILDGFERDRYYSHYYPVVKFMFGVGCRPGEAFGLRWRNVSEDFDSVVICEAVAKGEARATTKTGHSRIVSLSPGGSQMLRERFEKMQPSASDLVFPAPRGKAISDHTFRRRAWKSVLALVGVEYRKPYCMRHSAISHALRNGASPVEISEQSGHSSRLLMDVYAHAIDQRSLFMEF